ncbi:FG-GAP repeat domain-containing protein [Ilumatobacter sp.]|uniref:FG-GAP repeat domain-containing protein n=1 Tax=Ilumatobacter sp. TaxID=1967498 RepID=UPI003C5A161F
MPLITVETDVDSLPESTTTPPTTTSTTTTTSPPATSPATAADPATPLTAETCWESSPDPSDDDGTGAGISFEDVTAEVGLVDPLTGMHGHAAASGDVNRDGWTDLLVGGFADREASAYAMRGASGPSPDRLLLGGPDGFRTDLTFPEDRARSSGAVFADLDADGDDDLVITRNQRGSDGIGGRPTVVLENTGSGWDERNTLADGVTARSAAAVDLDRDGTLDLLIVGDRWGDGSTEIHRGLGGFEFDDVTTEWGVPDDFTGLAAATVDVDGDGWIDVVMNGDPRVLLGGDDGFAIAEVPALAWETFGDEDDPAGIAIGDLDGDDLPDLVLGQHFNSTIDFAERVPVRILVNRSQPGVPAFDDVTEQSGSPDLSTKSPHVAIADIDNDGLNDVITSAASAADLPLILHRNDRGAGESPHFETIGEEGSGRYWVTGVTDDLDRDGRVDALLVEWEPTQASVSARNTSAGGDWLEFDTASLPSAIGHLVTVEDPTTGEVLARAWPASTTGYAAGSSGVVHVGLGDAPDEVAVRIPTVDGDRVAMVGVNARTSFDGCPR